MISFVWPDIPFTPHAGGSEVYTLGQLNELNRRGIDARIITYQSVVTESLAELSQIPSYSVNTIEELFDLDDTFVFIFKPQFIPTKKQSYVMLHTAEKSGVHDNSASFANGLGDIIPITTSNYMSQYWKEYLNISEQPSVIYPFVDEVFGQVERQPKHPKAKILFAGRPTHDKGVFTLMASLHMEPLRADDFELSCVTAFNHLGPGKIIIPLLEAHSLIKTIKPRPDRKSMAELYAEHDIVVMPSSAIAWKEAFGMISVEAQHAGCRVVASNSGGLPETNCGLLTLVEPDNPLALAEGIRNAINTGPADVSQRVAACGKFTVADSVDKLLQIIS